MALRCFSDQVLQVPGKDDLPTYLPFPLPESILTQGLLVI